MLYLRIPNQTYDTLYKSLRFILKEKISGLSWESNPQPFQNSSVMLYQLSYQALWKQGGGE